jgi:hypothetical protein
MTWQATENDASGRCKSLFIVIPSEARDLLLAKKLGKRGDAIG